MAEAKPILPVQKLLKPTEVAALLAISTRHLWSLTKRGGIPCLRIGRVVRYDAADLAAWIESRKSPANGLD